MLDIIIISTMIFFLVNGLIRGFVREVASFAGVVLGIWLGSRFQPQMTEYLKAYLPSSGSFLPLASFAVLFTGILIFCNIAGWVLKQIFRKAFLGWADRVLGAGLAITKGVIVICLVIVLMTFYFPSSSPLIADSRLAPWIIVSYRTMTRLISPNHYQDWKKRFSDTGMEMGDFVADKVKEFTKKDE